jgi:hypothetical protein
MVNDVKESEIAPKQSYIWDSAKKRPSKQLLIILTIITIIIFILVIIRPVRSVHEIRVSITFMGSFSGEITIGDKVYFINGTPGVSEFTYNAQIGTTVRVHLFTRATNSDSIYIAIYDNGDLVDQASFIGEHPPIDITYTVGEG